VIAKALKIPALDVMAKGLIAAMGPWVFGEIRSVQAVQI
jgi:hypothetical protein